ncbi:hypothetical protein ACJX0J_027757 [Zea mays]
MIIHISLHVKVYIIDPLPAFCDLLFVSSFPLIQNHVMITLLVCDAGAEGSVVVSTLRRTIGFCCIVLFHISLKRQIIDLSEEVDEEVVDLDNINYYMMLPELDEEYGYVQVITFSVTLYDISSHKYFGSANYYSGKCVTAVLGTEDQAFGGKSAANLGRFHARLESGARFNPMNIYTCLCNSALSKDLFGH